MSDILQRDYSKTNRKHAPKKLSTKVDLTPMVDLGFLLITFFIFTTALTKPTILKLDEPKDDIKNFMPVKESGAMTILLPEKGKIFYYFGKQMNDIHQSGYLEIRNVILNKKKNTRADDFFVIIKPGGNTTYKNAIDLLSEMTINDIKRYAIADLQPQESEMILKYGNKRQVN